MKTVTCLLLGVAFVGILFQTPRKIQAQVSFGVQIGPEPNCPYGYFDGPPYQCAPYGYYGPEWFKGGAFLGAGPWFHGPDRFRGHVDSHYDPRHGYKGRLPKHGAPPDWTRHHGNVENFNGHDYREEKGHRDDDHTYGHL